MLLSALHYFAAPSRVLADRWAVYTSDGNLVRVRTRPAVFATKAEAEEFAQMRNRRHALRVGSAK